jgi:hypothetical protein
MEMRLEIDCAMCGRSREIAIPTDKGEPKKLRQIIEDSGWIVQQNGENFDTYCCAKCAR